MCLLPELWFMLMASALITVVSSSKCSGWRGMEQGSYFRIEGQSWDATLKGEPWASTNERAMQAMPERQDRKMALLITLLIKILYIMYAQ